VLILDEPTTPFADARLLDAAHLDVPARLV